MNSSQILIAVLAAVAVAAVALLSARDGGGGDGGAEDGKAPAGAVGVPFAYSPEKEVLLKPLIRRFNEEGHKSGGKPVFVEGQGMRFHVGPI